MKKMREARPKKRWDREWEHDMLMAIWLAIDKGNMELVKLLAANDISLRYIIILALKRKKEKPAKFKPKKGKKANGLGGEVKNSGAGAPKAAPSKFEGGSEEYAQVSLISDVQVTSSFSKSSGS